MLLFNYSAPAELYIATGRTLKFRRFPTAAEAIQFAVERLPSRSLIGSRLVVDEDEHRGSKIQVLYEIDRFPLDRNLPDNVAAPHPSASDAGP